MTSPGALDDDSLFSLRRQELFNLKTIERDRLFSQKGLVSADDGGSALSLPNLLAVVARSRVALWRIYPDAYSRCENAEEDQL